MWNNRYMQKPKQINNSTPYLITTQQQLKDKSKGQRNANTKITPARVIKEGTKKLSKKPLRHPPSSKMIH